MLYKQIILRFYLIQQFLYFCAYGICFALGKKYQNIPLYIKNTLTDFQIVCLFFPTSNKYVSYNSFRGTFRAFAVVRVFYKTKSFLLIRILSLEEPTTKFSKICLKQGDKKYFIVMK